MTHPARGGIAGIPGALPKEKTSHPPKSAPIDPITMLFCSAFQQQDSDDKVEVSMEEKRVAYYQDRASDDVEDASRKCIVDDRSFREDCDRTSRTIFQRSP